MADTQNAFLPPPGSPGLPASIATAPKGAGGVATPAAFSNQPTGRALEDQWMDFANNELGQRGQVGVVGGNAQANAAAAAARNNLGGTVDQYNAKYGASAKAVGEDKIDFGDGRGPVDVIAGGGNDSMWWYGSPSETNGTGPGSGAGGRASVGGGGGGGGFATSSYGGGGGSTSSSGPQGGDGWYNTTPGQGTDLFNQLLARSRQGLAVDANDPIIRAQTEAHNAQLDQGRTRYLQEQAERGGNNENIGFERRASAEQVGQAGAAFQSELMGREVTARREEIQNALNGMGTLLTAEQRLQLEEELAQLARSESRYQSDADRAQRESEFGRGLGQRGYEFDSDDRYRNSPLGPGN